MRQSAALLASLGRLAKGESAKPLVLLFGWLGSSERHVNKYATVWKEIGAQPLVHRPTIMQTAVPPLADTAVLSFASRIAAAFNQRREAAGGVPPDVIVQVMSGAGFMAYGTLMHLVSLSSASSASSSRDNGAPSGVTGSSRSRRMVSDPRAAASLAVMHDVMAATRGIVLDSAPPKFQAGIWSRGALSALLSTEAQNLERRYPLTTRAAREAAEMYMLLPGINRRLSEMRAAWAHDAPLSPQLYLFSTGDVLIPWKHVVAFQEMQWRRGVQVTARRWSDSGHCDHLRVHPQEYRQVIRDFMEQVCTAGGSTAGDEVLSPDPVTA